jgi:hypothetical protein
MNGSTNAYDFLGLDNRPTCDEFKKVYMNYAQYESHDVFDEVGGWIDDKHDTGHKDWANSCALRLSMALNALEGHKIPPGAPGANKGLEGASEPNDYQIISARLMRDYLEGAWGAPDYEVEAKVVETPYIDPFTNETVINREETIPDGFYKGIKSDLNCDCFCLVHASERHVGFIDTSGKVDGFEPMAGDDKKVKFWKLPCNK